MDAHHLKLMLGLGVLLLLSVLASKTSSKFGIPVLLVFIGLGMLAGPDGPGSFAVAPPTFTHVLGTVALVYILYSGGLSTKLDLVRPVWREGVLLSTLGVLVSTAIMATLVHFGLGWHWAPAALLGATISSTDAAAVFGILKTRQLGLMPRMQALLELESGSNDPMAVFLTLSLILYLKQPEATSWALTLRSFFIQMALGGFAGWWLGKLLAELINWLKLEFEGLYPVLTLSGVLSIYALTEFCGGNGFLSVYLAGLSMGNKTYFSRKTLGVFHDGVAWLMQVAMFLTLGLTVLPREIPAIAFSGIILSLGLILLARPLSTWICLRPFRYSLREIWFISWGGLRGAVPIILASYFLVEAVPLARPMFNTVFLVVIITTLVQGTSVGLMARLTQVQEELKRERKLPFKSRSGHSEFIEFYIPSTSHVIGKTILSLRLPKDVLVVLIHRGALEFIPRGNTLLEARDRLVCLAGKKSIPEVEEVFGSEHFKETRAV